jgi:lipopolysaccharide export LptBFGC system permease protein LptF
VSILDRYLIRLTIPPFLLALGVFTFVLAVEPMLDKAKDLLAKGVHVPDVGILVLCLLPSALSLTIPMSLLTGLLMALGRLSADREAVALLACGISPLRLLRPVLLVGLMVAGVDMYILMRATPQHRPAPDRADRRGHQAARLLQNVPGQGAVCERRPAGRPLVRRVPV